MKKNYPQNKIDLRSITYKTEELLEIVENRYKITIQVANKAKRRKYEDVDIIDDPLNKPVIKAIIEMVDEITEPKILDE
uniref:Putative DNA-directed RNA polymerase subunit omega n=1 Tax=Melanothamnus harveyi TaxID=397005 RepID=A0A1Z1MH95_MELHR|nr:putative DNA-directed RNA polymerase subunit omega [Melanothamnus harveyi]ARW65440.1 putative DNA-directed RNA polymerase subunit omega [Melanothamnus harveyi]